MKVYKIIGSLFRGRLSTSKSSLLYQVIRIIAAVICIRCWYFTPLRTHEPIPAPDEDEDDVLSESSGDDDDNDEEVDQESKEEKKETKSSTADVRDFRLMSGMRLGTSLDYKRSRKHGTCGKTPEPSNEGVNHGHHCDCFAINEHVLVWWWSCYWPARVQAIRHNSGTITVRWDRDNVVTAGYLPRLLYKAQNNTGCSCE
jgi:hypothetical protein